MTLWHTGWIQVVLEWYGRAGWVHASNNKSCKKKTQIRSIPSSYRHITSRSNVILAPQRHNISVYKHLRISDLRDLPARPWSIVRNNYYVLFGNQLAILIWEHAYTRQLRRREISTMRVLTGRCDVQSHSDIVLWTPVIVRRCTSWFDASEVITPTISCEDLHWPASVLTLVVFGPYSVSASASRFQGPAIRWDCMVAVMFDLTKSGQSKRPSNFKYLYLNVNTRQWNSNSYTHFVGVKQSAGF